jgi:hypothetical protein
MGCDQVVKAFFESDATVNVQLSILANALPCAAINERTEVLKMFLMRGGNGVNAMRPFRALQ